MQTRVDVYRLAKIGSGVIVRFGDFGVRYGHVVKLRGSTAKGVRVWRHDAQAWTKPRTLMPDEVERLATAADTALYQPDFGLKWEINF